MNIKYLLNDNTHGYEQTSVDDLNLSDVKEDTVIIVVDSSCDAKMSKYYKLVSEALKAGNRVIIVGLDDGNKSFKPLASLMVTYNGYDIYQVPGRESINAQMLTKIQERKPDYSEVQSYIGGDVTAYSDMSTMIFGIESLVNEGSPEQLKSFLENHMTSIEALTSTLNYMKKTCDVFNSGELLDKIEELKKRIDSLQSDIKTTNEKLDGVKFERDKLTVRTQELERDNNKLKNKNSELTETSNKGGSIIKSYREVNTQLLQCRVKEIIYFKEVSYVRYMNSLVKWLMENITKLRLSCKTVIFDSSTNLYNVYGRVTTVSGNEYLSHKDMLMSKSKIFVSCEPNTTILNDLLTSERCFDVIIVYDRIKQATPLITGNNVATYYVINSSSDYEAVKQALKISDIGKVITNTESTLGGKTGNEKKFLDIPYIDGYSTGSESLKESRYMRLKTTGSKVFLMDSILKGAHIDQIAPNYRDPESRNA